MVVMKGFCRYAFTLLKRCREAEDTVQFDVPKAWEKERALDIREDVRAYLYRSVYNNVDQIEHRSVIRKHNERVAHAIPINGTRYFPDELETKIKSVIESCHTMPDHFYDEVVMTN